MVLQGGEQCTCTQHLFYILRHDTLYTMPAIQEQYPYYNVTVLQCYT